MAQQVVTLRDLHLPEFDKNRRIAQQKALIFDNDNCQYDMILGTNFLSKTASSSTMIEAKCSGTIARYPCVLVQVSLLKTLITDHMEDMIYIQFKDELLGQDWLTLYATEILDARYKWTGI